MDLTEVDRKRIAYSEDVFQVAQKRVGSALGRASLIYPDGRICSLIHYGDALRECEIVSENFSLSQSEDHRISKSKNAYSPNTVDTNSDIVAYSVFMKSTGKNNSFRVQSNSLESKLRGSSDNNVLVKWTEAISYLSVSPVDKSIIAIVCEDLSFHLFRVSVEGETKTQEKLYTSHGCKANFVRCFPSAPLSWALFSDHDVRLVYFDRVAAQFRELNISGIPMTITSATFLDDETLVVATNEVGSNSMVIIKISYDPVHKLNIIGYTIKSFSIEDDILQNCDKKGCSLSITGISNISSSCFVTAAHAFSDRFASTLDAYIICWAVDYSSNTIRPCQIVHQVQQLQPGMTSFGSKSTISSVYCKEHNYTVIVYSESRSNQVSIFTSPLTFSSGALTADVLPLKYINVGNFQFLSNALSSSLTLDLDPSSGKVALNLSMVATYSTDEYGEASHYIERLNLPLSMLRSPHSAHNVEWKACTDSATGSNSQVHCLNGFLGKWRPTAASSNTSKSSILKSLMGFPSSNPSAITSSASDVNATQTLNTNIKANGVTSDNNMPSDSIRVNAPPGLSSTNTASNLLKSLVKPPQNATSATSSSTSFLKGLIGVQGTSEPDKNDRKIIVESVPNTTDSRGKGKVDTAKEDDSDSDDSSTGLEEEPPAFLPDYLVKSESKTPLWAITEKKKAEDTEQAASNVPVVSRSASLKVTGSVANVASPVPTVNSSTETPKTIKELPTKDINVKTADLSTSVKSKDTKNVPNKIINTASSSATSTDASPDARAYVDQVGKRIEVLDSQIKDFIRASLPKGTEGLLGINQRFQMLSNSVKPSDAVPVQASQKDLAQKGKLNPSLLVDLPTFALDLIKESRFEDAFDYIARRCPPAKLINLVSVILSEQRRPGSYFKPFKNDISLLMVVRIVNTLAQDVMELLSQESSVSTAVVERLNAMQSLVEVKAHELSKLAAPSLDTSADPAAVSSAISTSEQVDVDPLFSMVASDLSRCLEYVKAKLSSIAAVFNSQGSTDFRTINQVEVAIAKVELLLLSIPLRFWNLK